MARRSPIVLSLVLLLAPGLIVAACTCNRSQDPPPMPSAKPEATAAEAKLEIEPEDAEVETPDAAQKVTGKGSGGGVSLEKCCAALRQNAESSPQKEQMLMAAGACDAAVKSGSAAAVKAAVAPYAQGLPAGCR